MKLQVRWDVARGVGVCRGRMSAECACGCVCVCLCVGGCTGDVTRDWMVIPISTCMTGFTGMNCETTGKMGCNCVWGEGGTRV